MFKRLLFLNDLHRFADLGALGLRALAGAFLVWGVWNNVTSAERMEEFVTFLETNGFAAPHLMAPLSVYAQLIAGALLFAGLLTRWAGIVIAVNFIVGVAMVHATQDFRGWWPAIVLVAIGAHFAVNGGGRWSLDRVVGGAK